MSGRWGGRGEDGAFIALHALLVMAMFTMAAIGIDLSSLRQDRRVDRAAADAGATAGALSLTEANGGPKAGCDAAWIGAVRNVGYAPPGPGITTSPCDVAGSPFIGSPAPGCLATDSARSVTGTVGSYTITITTPVPDASDLLIAETAGGDTAQPVSVGFDGTQCERIAVTILRPRTSFFGGVVGSKSNTTTVHSVARALIGPGVGKAVPALVALNKTACQTINAGTGYIEAKNLGTKPGLIQADSNASGCSNSNHVLEVQGSGIRIKADAGSSGSPGQLYYYATSMPAQAYDGGRPNDYSGTFTKLPAPITRAPLDDIFHCSNTGVDAIAACTVAADPVVNEVAWYGTHDPPASPGPSLNTFPGLGQSCSSPPGTFAGNWKINCPSGFTVGAPILFNGGIIVFTGDVNIVSGGNLMVNASVQNDPVTGLPVPLASSLSSLLAIRGANGLTMQSSGAAVQLAQTLVYTANGGASLQGGPSIRWSPWSGGDLDGLLYWTEAATTVAFGGGPTFKSAGVVGIPNALLSIQGTGTLDATNVQFWSDRVETQGAAQFIMAPDPRWNITTPAAITHLIR